MMVGIIDINDFELYNGSVFPIRLYWKAKVCHIYAHAICRVVMCT